MYVIFIKNSNLNRARSLLDFGETGKQTFSVALLTYLHRCEFKGLSYEKFHLGCRRKVLCFINKAW